ncbi:MAG: hypothetical protein JJ850_08645 [Kordiimonadaceae bacterium]|nr:hypothetical protein [Kordiimonadaceae bacterium]MBO6569196.1 hypothetical protein [Kordiimonadaceae bacterium]MBO6964672.1 hypothetical protein [Kordiimonadaceae bacterium]
MKRICLAMSLLMVTCSVQASDDKYADKVETLDSTITTLYAVISGDKGVERDWDLFRYLFKPGARLIPSGKNAEGAVGMTVLSPEEYIERSGPFLVGNGFHEVEIGRRVDEFGTIAQVFSTYAAKRSLDDAEPFMRGINSIQLLKDNDRWWVVSIFWMAETEEFPLPADAID